ncbi:hypothetical protein BC827DRAFT_1199889 [Russula dissimulans]|nr:hypothetical protein BC827DRAFT_1199889 [Russula dissimulans]
MVLSIRSTSTSRLLMCLPVFCSLSSSFSVSAFSKCACLVASSTLRRASASLHCASASRFLASSPIRTSFC